jgi:2,4-didehydro-3-deoxy-L-rhamnonate hydrolase
MSASSVSVAEDDIVLWGPGLQHDWELELAIVIGRPARQVSRDEAMACVAGHTMSNDISTRDISTGPTSR